ncbi:MAG: 8-amino-7-oxononanoate synthase [Thermodesulfovibrionales bacterium]|nr:8-amino-7-oxononanoate synthase [Thermodesulfovibrionales bacterium]
MFLERLNELEKAGLLRAIIDRSSSQGRLINLKGRIMINFSSNDYLELSAHPLLKEAAIKAIENYGAGAGASRLLGGGTELHEILEERIARFKEAPSGLVLNSGYTANVSCIPCLETDYIFSDELNHASIIDGCRLSRSKVFIYRHCDTGHLEELLNSVDRDSSKVIITDSVFSMDGDIAPLKELVNLAERYNALLYIDDAHATGVLGDGRGSLRHFHISHRPFIIQMGTFSKALGAFGAYIVSDEAVKKWFINRARGFIYSTALPPSVIAMALKALEIIEDDQSLINKLWKNRESLLQIFLRRGLETGPTETPIIPVFFRDIEEVSRVSRILFDEGIYAPAIRPPTVKRPRLRFTVTASHRDEDFELLEKTLRKV